MVTRGNGVTAQSVKKDDLDRLTVGKVHLVNTTAKELLLGIDSSELEKRGYGEDFKHRARFEGLHQG